MNKKVILMILDGWGNSPDPEVSAIDNAYTPFIDDLYKQYPHATLRTDGLNVGLPDGQMGNSEVGHMNLGAGRIVYQDLAKINMAVVNNTLLEEPVLKNAFEYAAQKGKKVHFIGLLSDGGVHSHINHLFGLLQTAKYYDCDKVYVHAFTDGRDVDPKSGVTHLQHLQQFMQDKEVGKLASVIGRYYAMDRDRRWQRVKKAYDLLVKGEGNPATNIIDAVLGSYEKDITDEFIEPIVMVNENKVPVALVEEDDVVVFFNFRTDRGRELTQVLNQQDMPEFGMYKLPLYFVTLTNYDDTFQGIKVVYDKENLTKTLGEVLENHNKKQIRIAETEKYPHVTFFFSGGREVPFEGESRILCPSPKVATYDLKPEMSAFDITENLVKALNQKEADFVCLNFANGDMVGHTGSMEAAIKACEAVDKCVQKVTKSAIENGYSIIVIADHGNCETMKNPDGSPNTAHTTNPVPIIVVDKDIQKVDDGILADVAPTILKMIGVPQPEEMTGKVLV